MPDQLLPPPDLDHPLPTHLTPAQRVAVYLDLLDASEQMLIGGLKSRLPAGADLREAVRQVYETQYVEHLVSLERVAGRIQRIESQRACNRPLADT